MTLSLYSVQEADVWEPPLTDKVNILSVVATFLFDLGVVFGLGSRNVQPEQFEN